MRGHWRQSYQKRRTNLFNGLPFARAVQAGNAYPVGALGASFSTTSPCLVVLIMSYPLKRCLPVVLLGALFITTPSEGQALPFIAHAGGGYQNWQYTNTLQALDFNRDYFELFEIDFEWTSDGHLVCLHDWDTNAEWIFGQRFEAPVSLAEFDTLVASHPIAQNCTLETLIRWLQANPEKRLVTDIKANNIEGLEQLARAYGPGVEKQVIPQIYHPDEYSAARAAGYQEIIWSLYLYPGDESDILRALESMSLFALTMPRHWALQGLAARLPVQSYVHTVNTQREWAVFQALGISSLYTDWLPDPVLVERRMGN